MVSALADDERGCGSVLRGAGVGVHHPRSDEAAFPRDVRADVC
jgi:hypothetical protein